MMIQFKRWPIVVFLKKPTTWTVIAFASGVGVWPVVEYFQKEIDTNLHTVEIVCSLQERKLDTYSKIVVMSEEYSKIIGEKPPRTRKSAIRIIQLNEQLTLLRGGFRAAEAYLAELQNREPVLLNLEFRPPGKPGKPTATWR